MSSAVAATPRPGRVLDKVDLPHRFGPSHPAATMVTRQALLRKLRDASQLRQLIVIRAAAGAGKTLLLSQWSHLLVQLQSPFVWLTLETGHIGLLNTLTAMADAYRVTRTESMTAGQGKATRL